MNPGRRASRRQVLKTAVAAGAGMWAAPYFVPATALGLQGKAAPSDRITVGMIGTGGKGRHNMGEFLKQPDVEVVAINDVDVAHLAAAAGELQKKGKKDADYKQYADFRELLSHPDLNAVCISTPDHWHALPSIAAANAGKDIYCEKPLTNSIGEGRAVCNAVTKNKVILQTGSHERSSEGARRAAEIVRNGLLGEVKTVRINLPCDEQQHRTVAAFKDVPPPEAVPKGFDYNFWLGHTPEVAYTPKRCHFWWRYILAYGGGEMTDRGAHVIDIALMACNKEDTGPVEIDASGTRHEGSLYDSYLDYKFVNTYADGFKLIGQSSGDRGLLLEGTEGKLFVKVHGCELKAEPGSLLNEKIAESGIHLGRTPGHHRNFIDAVKARKQPFAPAEAGHRTASVCHLNNIGFLTGRKLKWDPVKEVFIGDDEANKLVTPSMRAPWSLG